MITKEDIKKAQRLIGDDDMFKSQYPGSLRTHQFSIGYIEELCEYTACLTDCDDKLERVLGLEDIVRKMLNGEIGGRTMVKGGIRYHPTWSKKLQENSNSTIIDIA